MPTDYEIVEAMRVYGGSFVRKLAELCGHADLENFTRIKATWPEYWSEYAEIARMHAAKREVSK